MTTQHSLTAAAAIAAAQHPDKRIPSNTVRDLCGGVSDMTLWRWLGNPAMNFPQPIYIARRRYWKEADVLVWLDAQASQVAA